VDHLLGVVIKTDAQRIWSDDFEIPKPADQMRSYSISTAPCDMLPAKTLYTNGVPLQMRILSLRSLLFVVPITGLIAQAPVAQVNVYYECAASESFKVLSCSGAPASAVCDIQMYKQGQPALRLNMPKAQVAALLLPKCHLQTPAEAQAHPHSSGLSVSKNGASQGGSGGFKAGDTVRVLINGWQEAKVIQVNGRGYVVHLSNGVEVSKIWPDEVRRVGKLTAEDHAAGQYDKGERVQVLVNGKWMEGEVRGQNLNMYNIKVAGVDTGFGSDIVDTTPQNIRMSTAPPPAAAAQRAAGQAPKPGLASCAGKYEGRWEHVSGMGGMKVVFRSGKATITEGLGGEMPFDCFTGGGKVVFYKAGSFTPFSYDFDINNDGTLQTPLGAIKKMGN
jgi:hypothetical protein